MTTLLFGNHILVMQLEIQWQEEQREKVILWVILDSCHGPHWHLSLYEYFTAAHTPCRSSKCSRNTQLQIPRITQGYTKWCITILIILHVYCVTACHILALKMSALCVPQINTICIQDIIFALIDIKCQPVRRCSYRGGHLGQKDVCGANTLH